MKRSIFTNVPVRVIYGCGALVCAGLIATALMLQHLQGLEPCPLCIVQRVMVMGLGAVLLVATVHGPRGWGRRVYGALVAIIAALGAAVAGRHVWLQSLPADQVPECGPGLEYMLQAFPFTKAMELVLRGSGECAEVVWRFLGLSIPQWTLLFFCAFAVFGVLHALWRYGDAGAPRLSHADGVS